MIPAICFMESPSVLEGERKAINGFKQTLLFQAREAKRDMRSAQADRLARVLETTVIGSDERLNLIESRLYECLLKLSDTAEVLGLSGQTMTGAMTSPALLEPTDNLILSCILDHARSSSSRPKAFLSANSRDFDEADAAGHFHAVGIRYFHRTDAALGWLSSQTHPDSFDGSSRPDDTSLPAD
ncbi:MAG: hypothetical protein AB7I30_11020 [Isosphaeraceae bacterium]